ncbi:MAG: chitinase [Nevskia sp.]
MINRSFFFGFVRAHPFKGRLRPSQVDGMTAILDEWEARYAKADDRWLAYMLATSFHETDATMQPIEEYGKGKGRPYGRPDPQTGKIYYGRGFVQLTWRDNYDTLGKLLKVDLVGTPELALDLRIASDVMFAGMTRGLFTKKKLADYFGAGIEDWVNARRIINGTDKANLIAGYGQDFYAAISYTTG